MTAARPVQAFVPPRYYAVLLDVLEERGHGRAALMRLAGIPAEAFVGEDSYLTLAQVEALVGRACELENTDELGLKVGERLQLMSHGALSMAALTSATVSDAINLVAECFALLMPLFELTVQRGDESTGVRLGVRWPLHPEVERFHTATMSGSVYAQFQFLLGGSLPEGVELDARHPRPPGLPDWVDTVRINLRFDRPKYELRIPTALLAFALPFADGRAHESARRRCLEQLEARPDPARLASIVTQALTEHGPPFLDLESTSRALGMSSRSLRRRLSEEGVSFRALQSEVRLSLAERWLADPRRSITDIGLELGYTDSANFSRAFRGARGRTPIQARAELLDRASTPGDSE